MERRVIFALAFSPNFSTNAAKALKSNLKQNKGYILTPDFIRNAQLLLTGSVNSVYRLIFTDKQLYCNGCSYTDLGIDLTNRTWFYLQAQACFGVYVALSSTTSFTGTLREFAFDWKTSYFTSGYSFAFALVYGCHRPKGFGQNNIDVIFKLYEFYAARCKRHLPAIAVYFRLS